MTLPRQHMWTCLLFDNDADCSECHPQLTCKNCGHTANQHSYRDEPAKFGWCPGCRGCGPHVEKEQPVMKHLRIFTLDGVVHHLGLTSEEETLKMFRAAMDNGHTISLSSGLGNAAMFNGKHIVCLQVCPGPIPVEENC